MLSGTQRITGIHTIPTAIILCREIIISGLREFLAATGQTLPVSRLAKYKTAIQMLAIVILLVPASVQFSSFGIILLWVSAVLTIITGVTYIRASFLFIRRRQKRQMFRRRKEKTSSQFSQNIPQ
jgi:cardiolipin synthase